VTVIELADVVFASDLQQQPAPDKRQVAAAISRVLTRHDLTWCVCQVAAEAGEHPECYQRRMRWALAVSRDYAALAATEIDQLSVSLDSRA